MIQGFVFSVGRESRTRYTDNESVTAAELSAFAKECPDPAKASEFNVIPVPPKPVGPR